MKAILIEGADLRWGEVATPEPGVGEVRIRVRASAVNRADLVQRAGAYAPPPGASPILGLECAGEIDAVGPEVANFALGDAVCALLAGGGYAEAVVVPAGQVRPLPPGLTMTEAAAIPEVFATAYLNLYMEGAATPGERFLVHAGASGVGTAAIQLGQLFSNPVAVTLSGAAKGERCVALGAEAAFDRGAEDFWPQIEAWAGPQGVDVILDPVGGAYLEGNMKVLAVDGRLVIIGLMGGAQATLGLGLMMVKRQRVIGSTLRARSVAAKAAVMDALEQRLWPAFGSGALKPIIETTFPMAEAGAAHRLIAENGTVGKVLLTLD
ncbi:MAG: NAD(P)H-quinone oxidoreductase [Gammaproteobacteria bacterium]|jgi:putative PIG3 family NAD(P)H quinone oxidoreductase|nr:NAD(P)H-quinone oxidoreductase [Gammaproteobacteria bacterium]